MASIKISELSSLTQKDYNDVIPIVDTSANETKKVSIETLIDNNVKLLTVSDEAPSSPTQGDKYYNTTNNKIYTYVGGNEWYDNGTPKQGILYIVFDEQTTYAYNGTTLVSVGGGQGSMMVVLKSVVSAPVTFAKGDKYYDSTDDLIYTATSSSTWNDGETADELTLYLNEYDNKLYRYYDNGMYLEGGGGETLPVGTELDFDGSSSSIPTGWEQIDNPEEYSTTQEIKTNKVYIENGVERPIYRNWISFLNPAISQNSEITVAHNIPNIDTVVDKYGWKIRGKNSTTQGSFFPNVTTGGRITNINNITTTNVVIRSTDPFNAGNYYFEGYIEYTKTTD